MNKIRIELKGNENDLEFALEYLDSIKGIKWVVK